MHNVTPFDFTHRSAFHFTVNPISVVVIMSRTVDFIEPKPNKASQCHRVQRDGPGQIELFLKQSVEINSP